MKDERIDNYILGRMSDEERIVFENEMLDDLDLKEEVDLRKDIVRALHMERDKKILQSIERNIQAKERRLTEFRIPEIAAEAAGECVLFERDIQAKERRHTAFGIQKIGAVAAAACVLFGCVLHFDTVSTYKNLGYGVELNTFSSLSRGDDGVDVVSQIVKYIENEEFDQALDVIHNQSHDLQLYDSIEWYEAVTYMCMGKYLKAKRLLREIASSDSLYKEEAKTLLDRL